MKTLNLRYIITLLLVSQFGCLAAPSNEEKKVLVGDTATLQCPIAERCGILHSIRWYKEESRIALLAESANLAKAEGNAEGRIVLSLANIGELKLTPVELDDDGLYRCDLTYLEPKDNCKTVHSISLSTLLKPSSLVVTDENSKEIKSGSPLGGLLENGDTTVECKAIGGRPAPTLTWTLGGTTIPGDVSTSGEDEETITMNRLVFTNERKYQGAQLKCSATSEALTDPMIVDILLDLILRPTNLTISGVEHHVVQGTEVTLKCTAEGARPPAVITWMNDTEVIPAEQIHNTNEAQTDGTYKTISSISFTSTRWDNGQTFSCESRQLAAPLESSENNLNTSYILDVQYPPVVLVRPENITVNENMDILLFCDYEANPIELFEVSWLRNDLKLDVENERSHYGGGDLNEQTLLIKNSSEEDIGNYYCQLKNSVGSSISSNYINVDIYFKPEVQLIMDIDGPIIESAKQNVTLQCEVTHGNPSNLLEVRWYLDDELLKQLPDCNTTEDGSINDMCSDVEPTQLLLEEAARSFHGNYSCQGKTLAGWGPRSNDTELIVNYKPGQASLIYSPERVIKGGSLKLTCSVEDYGRPIYTRFQWHRGTELIPTVVTPDWLIDPVELETEANFSCRAVNDAGAGIPAVVFIDVSVPPTFITALSPSTGILYNSSDVSLTCRIECSPLCNINWTKNGELIEIAELETDLYTIINTPLEPDSSIERFESIHSELVFNMSNWPNMILDRVHDNANYSCYSFDSEIGSPINSSTQLSVEFPPENMTVSNKVITVTEDDVLGKIICSAKGNPSPAFKWIRYNTTNNDGKKTESVEVLSTEYGLKLKKGVKRTESGDLICEANNIHGSMQISTYLNVKYKPDCTITEDEYKEERVLICTADANPTEVTFNWSLQNENDTIDEEATLQMEMQSYLKLEQITVDENPHTFVCVVNNSVGTSSACSLLVKGILPWYKWWSRTALLVAAGVGILLILVILLCLIILCICRRRRAASMYNSPTSLDEQDNSTIQNEASIVQAIVSQSIPGISKSQMPTTPNQYSDKSRLVPSPNKFIMPQSNRNPMAISNHNVGRLQADLSLLEASYQASLAANKHKSLSTNNLVQNENDNSRVNFENEKSNSSALKKSESQSEMNINNNNNDIEVLNDNIPKENSDGQGLTVNKWPLKPGVLVHVNSNHSLSPKKFNRTLIKPNENACTNQEEKTKINSEEKQTGKGGMLHQISGTINTINQTGDSIATTTNQSGNFDVTKCKNIMKSDNMSKKSAFSRIFQKMDLIIGIGKQNKSETNGSLSNAFEKQDHSSAKKSKSNKMALSLMGFVLKDEKNKGKGIKSIFQSNSPVLMSSEGVVTFRRPKINDIEMISKNDVVVNEVDCNDNDNSEDVNTSGQSRSSSSSRKRKKPGEAPANGGVDGTENPGEYENLPFHGLQQAPNKPVQVIQPRVVRTLAVQCSAKSPEAILEKQLQCNPSFTPRILSCPPFSHNPNFNISKPPQTNIISTINEGQNNYGSNKNAASIVCDISAKHQPPMYPFPHGFIPNRPINNLNLNNNNVNMQFDENQKYFSLNMKRDRLKKPEPRFNSMKIVRKRKLDRFYPSKNRIDYILVNKNIKKNEVIYANYPAQDENRLGGDTNDSFDVSFQNLTDSIQIHENSCLNMSASLKRDNKTPTPAPRLNKSPAKGEIHQRTSSKEHVYANVSAHIYKNSNSLNDCSYLSEENSNSLTGKSAFIPMANIPKTLPRRTINSEICCKNVISKAVENNEYFNSSTFPKRTTKSGKLLDSKDDNLNKIHRIDDNENRQEMPKGKIISSKTPSRNHSFNEIKMEDAKCSEPLPSITGYAKKNIPTDTKKISPSIVDATPKVKPFTVSPMPNTTLEIFNKHPIKIRGDIPSVKCNDLSTFKIVENKPCAENKNLNESSGTNIIPNCKNKEVKSDEFENRKRATKLESIANNTLQNDELFKTIDLRPNESKSIGKVIPKQHMLIQPAKTPLQIPNLMAKPVPKIQPIQLKRSQSSLSGKGISSELLQQYKGASGLQDGSLVKAKIRELNLRQPYRPDINDQLIYADADPKDYGPINYKQASIYARMKKVKEQQKMELARKDDD